MTIIWADVSHHDWNRRGGNMDWPAVRSQTSSVMCARATYGDPAGFSPPTYHFADFQTGARNAGFSLRGGYHNLVRGDAASMRRQVDWFRRELDSQGCHWAMLDIERYKELVERNLWPEWSDVLRFRDAWHAVESRPLAYYLPKWLWSGYYGTDLRQLPGPLVQSHYLTGIYGSPTQIYNAGGGDSGTGWDDYYGNRYPDIWQYSATCTVAGASDQTDVNAFRGSLEQLTALLTGDDMSWEQVLDYPNTPQRNPNGFPIGQIALATNDAAFGAWNESKVIRALLEKVAEKVDLDPAELEQIKAAASAGAEAGIAKGADELAAALAPLLDLDVEAVKAALAEVLGSARIVVAPA